MNKYRWPASVVSALVAVILIGACGGSGSTSSSTSTSNLKDAKPFTISLGDIVPFTGQLSQTGPAYEKASNLAVQQAQKALDDKGITNVKIAVKHVDSGASPDDAVNGARTLIQGGANCITGPLDSASTIAVARSATIPAHVPHISPSASSALVTGVGPGTVWRLAPSDALQGQMLGNTIANDLHSSGTVTLAGRNDAFGQGVLPTVDKTLKGKGLHTSGPIYYDPNATSFDSEASKIVAGSPDAFVIIDQLQSYGKLSAALIRTGKFDATKLYLAGAWPAVIPDYIPKAGLEGARGTSPTSDLTVPAATAFDQLFKSSSGVTTRQASDQNNFDATMLCILAALTARSGDPKAIAKQVLTVSSPSGLSFNWLNLADGIAAIASGKKVKYQGIGGPCDLKPNGDVASGMYKVFVYKDSKQVTLSTARVAG